METQNLKRFAELKQRLATIEAEKKALNQELEELQDMLITQMEEDGVQNMTINITDENGLPKKATVYVNRRLFTSPTEDRQALCEALQQAGLDDYVKPNFNTNSLNAYVREFAENGDDPETIREKLPDPLKDQIKVSEKFELKARAS